ncbi:SpoIID/LytB domain-containing protein [bacterium]|nr:SpoIID/LytB domain-containing protein [bacterium]RQV93779.1 MAG: SpoIID/LytB domain-containing protein [bacterium]
MKKISLFVGLIIFLSLVRCAVKQPEKLHSLEPMIQVGLLWGQEAVEFSVQKSFQITSHDGTFIATGVKGNRWRAEIRESSPNKVLYILVAASVKSEEKADTVIKEIVEKGFHAFIQPTGEKRLIGNQVIHDNRSFRVCLQEAFASQETAEAYRDSIWGKLETTVVEKEVQKAQGIIILRNLENNQTFESSNPIVIQGTEVTLCEVPVGTGFHFERNETRTYPEQIRFELDSDGKLAVINTIPLEVYLQGVLPAEMPNGFPFEALKAQAVAARSEALAKLGSVHLSDPFDLCATVHCQSYSGLSGYHPTTNQAVQETEGLVLWYDDTVCDAVYSAVCGGHGEDNNKTWGGEPKAYLQGSFDGSQLLDRYGLLSDEQNIQNWIDDKPIAYCNTIPDLFPEALDYTKKYFRWEVQYTQQELKEILQTKIEWQGGDVLDLIPLQRGVSGRIIKLLIVGTDGECTVDRELAIRQKLSLNTLWSSCFYVIRKDIQNGIPSGFILKGAGFGHGVGMCQTGAAVMALLGYRFDQILKHYYQDVQIKQLY